MNLWSVFKSPLMMGGYLPENDELTLQLLTNEELIRVNQQSRNNRLLRFAGEQVIWAADDPTDNSVYLALFNIGECPSEVTFNLDELQLGSQWKLKDMV